MSKRKLEMNLLNSEEMKGISGGGKVGDVLACGTTSNAQVIQCQTMEAGCSGGTFTPINCTGTSSAPSFGAYCVPSNSFYKKCTCNYSA
jgi:hypothetical protein